MEHWAIMSSEVSFPGCYVAESMQTILRVAFSRQEFMEFMEFTCAKFGLILK